MANILAVASGNWSSTSTWTGGVLPGVNDYAVANNKTVTIDQNVTCVQISNDTQGGATAGGGFTLNNGVTVTANLVAGSLGGLIALAGSNSATITGNLSNISSYNTAIAHSSTGTLTYSGSISAGSGNASHGITISSTGAMNYTGGTVTGGSSITTAYGINNSSSGTITATGTFNAGAGGSAINNTSTGTLVITGNCTASATASSIQSSSTAANVTICGSFIGSSNGVSALYVAKFKLNTVPVGAKTRYALNGSTTYVDMFTIDSTNTASFTMPAVTDVRSGVAYAGTGSGGGIGLTGTAFIPPAASVAYGTPVDATTGTAVLTPSAVQAALLPLL